jgi:hypothetical protein
MPFNRFQRLLQSGDAVRAGTINQPLRTTAQNVAYLYELLQAAALGSTVYAYDQTVEAEAVLGMAVYYNEANARFERGLATAETNADGTVTTNASARVWGVVGYKTNATLADVLLFGLDAVDVTAATDDGTQAAGTYYLSAVTAGKLTRTKPPVAVAVLRATGDGKVFVMPQFVDYLDRHTHYRFALTCLPAGDTTPPSPGDRHVISEADSDQPGWLPVTHPLLADKAPAGAVFGYNLDAHPALKNAWPTVPVGNVYVEWDRGTDQDVGGTGVPLGNTGLVVVDRNGIWWMSDCYGDVPWPTDLDTSVSESLSESLAPPECPRNLYMRMSLYYTRVNFATDGTAVLSLRSGDGRIRVRCVGTETPGVTGHLELSLNLNLTVTDAATGYLALKSFDPDTSVFTRGPVVEGLYTESDQVVLSGDVTRHVDPADEGSPRLHAGKVLVTVVPAETAELDVQLVRLDGAQEEFFRDCMYIGFAAGEQRAYRARLQVPDSLAIPTPRLKLRFQILGRAAGTLPALTVTAKRVPRPADGLTTPADLPDDTAEFAVTVNTEGVLDDAGQYVEAEAESFEVAAGDTVFFSVERADDDGYDAEVGVLRQTGVLFSQDDSDSDA